MFRNGLPSGSPWTEHSLQDVGCPQMGNHVLGFAIFGLTLTHHRGLTHPSQGVTPLLLVSMVHHLFSQKLFFLSSSLFRINRNLCYVLYSCLCWLLVKCQRATVYTHLSRDSPSHFSDQLCLCNSLWVIVLIVSRKTQPTVGHPIP